MNINVCVTFSKREIGNDFTREVNSYVKTNTGAPALSQMWSMEHQEACTAVIKIVHIPFHAFVNEGKYKRHVLLTCPNEPTVQIRGLSSEFPSLGPFSKVHLTSSHWFAVVCSRPIQNFDHVMTSYDD